MSLAIEPDDVVAVLLADGWHQCDVAEDEPDVSSFELDAYEYVHSWTNAGHRKLRIDLAGGSVPGVPSTGARWIEPDGSIVCVPLTAILAVKLRAKK